MQNRIFVSFALMLCPAIGTCPATGSSKAAIKVIAEARRISSPIDEESATDPLLPVPESIELSCGVNETPSSAPSVEERSIEERDPLGDSQETFGFPSDCSPGVSRPMFPSLPSSVNCDFSNESRTTASATTTRGPVYPPFPCPFCDRAYTSWGFRRRHIKAVHTISPRLNCKWCFEVLPTHAAWRRHVVSAHNLSASDAHNGLLILEEAHMVLQIANPTRLGTLVNIIKENSQQQNSAIADSLPQRD